MCIYVIIRICYNNISMYMNYINAFQLEGEVNQYK